MLSTPTVAKEPTTTLKQSFEALEAALEEGKERMQRLDELTRDRAFSITSLPRASTTYFSSSFFLTPEKHVPVNVVAQLSQPVLPPHGGGTGGSPTQRSPMKGTNGVMVRDGRWAVGTRKISDDSGGGRQAIRKGEENYGGMSWNQYFQAVYEETLIDIDTKVFRLREFFTLFRDSAELTVKKFVDMYLDESECENIEYAPDEDITTGCALRVTLLDDGQYKQYHREIQHQFLFLRQQLAVLEHPVITALPQVIVHYKGRMCLVTADTSTTRFEDEYLNVVVQLVCESLNLTPEFAEVDTYGEEAMVPGVQKAQFGLGTDGRFYIKSMLNLLPHFPPSRGTMLRPDEHTLFISPVIVANYRVPLCPGSFQMHGTRDSLALNKSTRECIGEMCKDTLSGFVAELVQGMDDSATGADVVSDMHAMGINVALLALVYDAVRKCAGSSPAIATKLLTEMVCRAAKELLRSRMQRRLEVDEITEEIGELCAKFCNEETRQKAWMEDLLPTLCRKFPGFATLLTPAPQPKDVDMSLFLERLQELMGFTFAPGVTPDGASAFHFSVMELRPVTRVPNLRQPTVGPLVLTEGKLVPANTRRRSTSLTLGRRLSPVVVDPAISERFTDNPGIRLQALRSQFLSEPTQDNATAYYTARKRLTGIQSFVTYVTALDIAMVFRRVKQLDAASSYIERASRILLDITASKHGAFGPFAPVSGDDKQRSVEAAAANSSLFQALLMGEKGLVGAALGHFHETVKSLNASMRLFQRLDPRFEQHECISVLAVPFAAVLAQAYEDKGLVEEAEPLNRQVLQACRHGKGESSLAVCAALNNLAINLYQQEKYDEAEELYLEDLKVTEKVLGKDDLSCASSLNNLACLYDKVERYEESIGMHNRDIALSEQILGSNHPDVATSRNNLAAALMKQRRYNEAIAEYNKAYEIRKAHFGEKHVSVAETLNNIAALKREQGKLIEAKKLWEQALGIYEETVGRSHFKLRQCLDNLQQLSEDLNLQEDAEKYMEWLMDLKRADNDVYTAQQDAIKET